MDGSAYRELFQFIMIALPLWGVWFSLRGRLKRIENVISTRMERMEYVLGHKLIRVESAICLEAGKSRRHTTDMFMPKLPDEEENKPAEELPQDMPPKKNTSSAPASTKTNKAKSGPTVTDTSITLVPPRSS